MSLSLVYEYGGSLSIFTYNGPQCFIDISRFFTEKGADIDEIIESLIDAFELVIDATLFEPAQYLIDADQPHFLQAVLACTNSIPEILGAATYGYIDSGNNQGGGARFRNGLAKYILSETSSDDVDKIDAIHYKQIRNPISHSFVVSLIWLDSQGDSYYETSEEVYKHINENSGDFDNHEALLMHLRDKPYAMAKVNVVEWTDKVRQGFKRYIGELRGGDSLLRDNFMRYITQRVDWKSLLEGSSDN